MKAGGLPPLPQGPLQPERPVDDDPTVEVWANVEAELDAMCETMARMHRARIRMAAVLALALLLLAAAMLGLILRYHQEHDAKAASRVGAAVYWLQYSSSG